MQVQLILADEQHKGRAIPINVPSFMIGRSEGCNLRSRNPSVSRYHCTIQIINGTVTVQDLGGENGTFVNGNRITSLHSLKHGDKLVVGTHTFVVTIKTGTGKQDANNAGSTFELTPAPIAPQKSEESGTHPVDPSLATAVIQQAKSAQEPEVMFELRLDGQRVSVTKNRLFDLARKGSVSPDDLITVAGTKVFADSIQGIVFGNASSTPPPPPPPSAPPRTAPPQPAAPTPAPAAPESAPFDFPDIGDIGDGSGLFDDIAAAGPTIRVARKESAFSAIWKALDISFSRVYTMEGNNLVIHSIKALYYVLVVVCMLVIFWIWFEVCRKGIEDENLLAAFSDQFIPLAIVTFGCMTIIVVVRVLIEMLLLAWLEAARQEEEEREGKK